MQHILVIDDDESVRDLLKSFFTGKGYVVTVVSGGQSGLDLMLREKYDLFFIDLNMPGLSGLDVLKEMSARSINTPVIMITAYATVKTAVDAMRLGAFDYVTKPFILDELLHIVDRALSMAKLQKENASLKKQLKRKYDYHRLIGNSPQMQKMYELIEKISDTDSTVLLYGESGTGKEVVAKTLHYNSSRAQSPFVPLNCAAIPKDLLESELFGHEKGAFTGAVNARIGRFELANGGTLFLDEIGELHPSLQVKLLRVLQEREFERVGGTKTVKVDVRILAATNKDLEKATREGIFREDLYYRLNVIFIHIPPLRKRREDIPLLLDYFINAFSKRKKKEPLKVSHAVMEHLMNYHWPGNVRELENFVERLVILDDDGVVALDDLPERFLADSRLREGAANPDKNVSVVSPADILLPHEGVNLNDLLDEVEKRLILQAMVKAGGVKKKAATLLGLNRTTLLDKLKKKGIEANVKESTLP